MTGIAAPSTDAGVKTNCRAAATADASNAAPPVSSTVTFATLPVASMEIWSMTAEPLPDAISEGGNSASTNVTSFGGTITRRGACALAGAAIVTAAARARLESRSLIRARTSA